MHCCNINKSRRGGFFFGSPGMYEVPTVAFEPQGPEDHDPALIWAAASGVQYVAAAVMRQAQAAAAAR